MPEPTTIILFGIGLAGLSKFKNRFGNKVVTRKDYRDRVRPSVLSLFFIHQLWGKAHRCPERKLMHNLGIMLIPHGCRQATAQDTTMAMTIHTMALSFPAYPGFSSMQAKKIPRDTQRTESSGVKRNHIHATTLSMNTSLSYYKTCFDQWKYICLP